MKYFKKIIGEKVYLSPVSLEDAEEYTRWFNDLEISLNLGGSDHVYSLEKEKEILEKMIKERNAFAIVTLEDDKLIGNCSLMNIEQVHRKTELGIVIGNKEYWNQGYGSEVINLLLDYGFNILNLNNIMLRVFSFNHRAFRCYEKCGFKVIGRRRDSLIFGNRRYDEIYMDILAAEFTGKILNFMEE